MESLSKEKECAEIGPWIKSISNHLYWSAATGKSSDEVVARWTSVTNHVQNIHVHENHMFSSCLHGPIPDEERRAWLKPSEIAT